MLRHLRYFLCIIFENDEKYIIGLSYTFNVHIGTLFLTKCNWIYIVCVKLSRAIAWQKKTQNFYGQINEMMTLMMFYFAGYYRLSAGESFEYRSIVHYTYSLECGVTIPGTYTVVQISCLDQRHVNLYDNKELICWMCNVRIYFTFSCVNRVNFSTKAVLYSALNSITERLVLNELQSNS